MRDHLFAQKTDRVQDLLMRRRAGRAQQDHLFNAHCLINLDKADAFLGGADAELCALFAHFGGCGFARMGAGGESLVESVRRLPASDRGAALRGVTSVPASFTSPLWSEGEPTRALLEE